MKGFITVTIEPHGSKRKILIYAPNYEFSENNDGGCTATIAGREEYYCYQLKESLEEVKELIKQSNITE